MFFLEGGERGLDFLGMVGVVVDNHDFVILRRIVIKSSSHSLEIIYARDDFFLRNPEKPAKPDGQDAVFAEFSARQDEFRLLKNFFVLFFPRPDQFRPGVFEKPIFKRFQISLPGRKIVDLVMRWLHLLLR